MINPKYQIIHIDPPWSYYVYSNKTGDGRSAAKHYDTQEMRWIRSLPVKDIAADDCVLFCWVSNPSLPDCLQVIEDWGFNYKTVAFCWVKNNKIADSRFFGLGFWTRANCELCILATRGQPHRISKSVGQIIDVVDDSFNTLETKIGRHSEKPVEALFLIEDLLGENRSRIDIFARELTEGWDTWGDEILSVNLPNWPQVPIYTDSIYFKE